MERASLFPRQGMLSMRRPLGTCEWMLQIAHRIRASLLTE